MASNLSAGTEDGGLEPLYMALGSGGLPVGMGGAFTAVANDGNAPFYNPAGLPTINKKKFSINFQNSFVGGANFIYISYIGSLARDKQGLGVSFLWDGVSGLSGYSSEQNSTGTYSVTQLLVGVSYGLNIAKNFYGGIMGKFFYNSIASFSANTVDADIGFMYNIFKGFKFGITFHNLLPLSYKLYNQDETIPFSMNAGISYSFLKDNLILSYEIEKQVEPSFDAVSFHHHFGATYRFLKYFSLNGGYNNGDITFGLQVLAKMFSFFTGTSQNSMAGNLNFAVSYEIYDAPSSELEMEYFYEGVVAYQNKDYRTAVKYFQKVLEKKDNPIAKYYLDNANAYLESEKWMSEEDKALVGMKFDLAKKYIAQGFYGKAIESLRDVLELEPSNEEAQTLMAKVKARVSKDVEEHYNKALTLFNINKYQESLKECEMALDLNPEHKPTLELKKKNEDLLKDVLASEKREEQKKAEAEALYEQGLADYQNENWVEAINNFKKSYALVENKDVEDYLNKAKKKLDESKITAKHKEESDAHLKVGLSFYTKNKLKDAISEFEKAVNIYPDNQEAVKYLDEARSKYDAIIDEPLNAGKEALREGRLGDAIDNFNKVLKIDPNNAVAKQFLNKAQSLIKDNIASNLRLAESSYKQGNYKDALAYYRNVLKLDPTNKDAKKGEENSHDKLLGKIKEHYNTGIEFFKQKDMKKAIDEFQKALAIDPEYAPANDFLKKAQEEYEKNKFAYMVRDSLQDGIDLFQNKNFQQAKDKFQKVLELDPNNQKAKDYISKCDNEIANLGKQEEIAKIIADGMIKYRKRNYDEAIKIWEQVESIDPGNKIIGEYIDYAKRAQKESMDKFYNNGVNYFQNGDLLNAKESFQKALDANPKNDKAKKKLAEVKSVIFQKEFEAKQKGKDEFSRGNYDRAIKYFEEFLSYEKENDEIEDYLKISQDAQNAMNDGEQYFQNKQYGDALEKFNLVLDLNKDDKNAQAYKKKVLIEGKKQASEWFNQGMEYYDKGDLKRAYIRFSSVVEIDPNHKEAKDMRDRVSNEIDRKSIKLYRTGVTYYENGDYNSAIKTFQEVLDLKNNYKDTRILLAKAQRKYAKLTEKDREAVKKKVQVYLYNGIKLYQDGKLEEAIDEWNKVLEIDPGNSKVKSYINRAKYKLKQLEKLK